MTDKQFRRLLEKYQAGHCTPEEEKLVEQWYASFEGEEDGVERLSENQKVVLEAKILGQIRNRMQVASGRKTILLMPFVKISAAALLLIFFGYFLWYWVGQTKNENDFLTIESSGEIKKVILSDGTLVWLKGKSKLTYPQKFEEDARERNVILSGEAFFEVAKNPHQPFLIQCGEIEAKVLGTSFNIKQSQEKQQVEIVVLTGKVAVATIEAGEKQGTPLVVEPMEQAIAGPEGFSKNHLQSMATYTQGTAYDMRFDESSVQEVIKRIEQKFDVEIHYKDASGNCRITADFTDQSLEKTLQMLTATLEEVTYQVDGKTVRFQGKACQ